MATMGEDSGPCPHCGHPTKVVDWDSGPEGQQYNISYECERDGMFGYDSEGKLIFMNQPRPLDQANEWPLTLKANARSIENLQNTDHASKPAERLVAEVTCNELRKRPGTWYAYRNEVLDSANAGHVQCLKVGPDCTYKEPPAHAPDGPAGPGWKYRLLGLINVEDGTVTPMARVDPFKEVVATAEESVRKLLISTDIPAGLLRKP